MDRGYSTHSRHLMGDCLEKEDQPVLQQIKQAYWKTKQQIIKTMGKREDEHVVASDAQLDAKLELFKQIKMSCVDLHKLIYEYQKRLIVLAREENAMGKFLKQHGDEDATRAGSMMIAVGKSQAFTAQHRILLRKPLYRLYQEVETFRQRAIADTMLTVDKMEEARTEYRAALLWMQDVSEKLDPDAYNRLEKFRKVQNQVRKAKENFDKYKLDVLQKVDLLAASRSNMYSHALAAYQNSLLTFWQKTSRTMNAVSETFKGFQYYEFNMLKDLDDTTRELAEQTASQTVTALLQSLLDDTNPTPQNDEDKLIYEIIMSLKATKEKQTAKSGQSASSSSIKQDKKDSLNRQGSDDSTCGLLDLTDKDLDGSDDQFGEFQAAMDQETRDQMLLGEDNKDKYQALRQAEDDLLTDIFGADEPLLSSNDFLESQPSAAGGFLPADLFDIGAMQALQLHGDQTLPPPPVYSAKPNTEATQPMPKSSVSKNKQPISAWYNLFADLDPLQDPDAIGKSAEAAGSSGCA